jgi:F-type H+-transporting ATPase subunit delta
VAEISQVARPYAQAVFDLAATAGGYEAWTETLAFTATVSQHEDVRTLAQNPRVSKTDLAEFMTDLCYGQVADTALNFLKVVIHNGRISALPAIAAQYEVLRAEAEGTVDAEVISARPIDAEQQGRIAAALERRLGKKVNLAVRLDESLLGGAMVRAGDLVIDGSARERLDKLALALSR